MTRLRKSLALIVAISVALAPVAAAAAMRTGSGSSSQESAATAAPAAGHCHKPAESQSKAPEKSSHCKHCDDAGACTPDSCALKCFKVVAEVPAPSASRTLARLSVRPASLEAPPYRTTAPPAPPPRA